MKNNLSLVILSLLISCTILPLNSQAQVWKKNFEKTDVNFRDFSIARAQDGTNNILLAGTIFDMNTQKYSIHLIRFDIFTATSVFEKTLEPDINARGLNATSFVTNLGDTGYAITGFTEVNGFRKALVILIDETGNITNQAYYDLEPSGEHSQGVHIQSTPNDPDEGFVLVGVVHEDDTGTSYNSVNKQGFCLKIKQDLTIQWAKYINSQYSNVTQDFDAASHVEVTDQGYFITGGKNIVPFFHQQAALAIMLDNSGNLIWDSSYENGNAFDNGSSVYYDQANQKIYMLVNYSAAHHFGITAIDAATGNIDNIQSMTTMSSNLDKYGFCLQKSPNPNSLLVLGYAKDEFWQNNPIVRGAPGFLVEYNYNSNTLGLLYLENELSLAVPEQFGLFEPFGTGQFPPFYYSQGLLFLDQNLGSVYVSYKADTENAPISLQVHKMEHPKFELCDTAMIDLDLGNCCFFTFSDTLNLTDINQTPQNPNFNEFNDPSQITGECFLTNQQQISTENINWTITPNPSEGEITIQFNNHENLEGHLKLQIFNANGTLIKEQELQSSSKKLIQNLQGFPPGYYLISIVDNQFNRSVKPLILSR